MGDGEETYRFMAFEDLRFHTQYEVPMHSEAGRKWLLANIDEQLAEAENFS